MTDIRIIVPTAVRQSQIPTLFDDYGSNPFAGEAFALAVNDNHATTVYDYVARFAPGNGIVPALLAMRTPIGDPAKPGSSGVNPNAADEFLAIDRAGLATALNNATYNTIFGCTGCDLSDGTDNDEMTLTLSGSDGDERFFTYWNPDNANEVQDIKPWKQAQVDRVQMPRIVRNNAGFTWFVGLSWGITGTQIMRWALFTGTANNNFDYRCLNENSGAHGWNCNSENTDNNMAFECVSREHTDGTTDIHGFVINSGSNNKVVRCEGANMLGDFFQLGNGVINGWVVEDCDYERTVFYDGAGNIDAGGDFGAGEGFIDVKKANPDAISTGFCEGNRVHGMRRVDPVKHPGGGTGTPAQFSNTGVTKRRVAIRRSISWDCSDGGFDLRGVNLADEGGNHSLVRCIFDDIRGPANAPVMFVPNQTTEIYLCSVTNSLNASALLKYFRTDSSEITVHDCMGCFFQDTGAIQQQSNWGANVKFGYHVYAGTFTTASADYPVGHEAPSKASLNMGNMTFIFRKMTGPDQHTINGIVPTTSTPSAARTLVPTTGGVGNDQIGSRTGIGVDDLF